MKLQAFLTGPSIMESIWMITILSCLVNLGNSQTITTSINAKEFMKDSPAELGCLFPAASANEVLNWQNDKLRAKLICSTATNCNTYPGYKLSRNGSNITLIIEKVMKTQNQWQCANIMNSLSKFINFKVIENPPLSMNVTHIGSSDWELTSSCSHTRPNITCMNNFTVIPLKNIQENYSCDSKLLFRFKASLQSNYTSSFVKCHAERGNEKIDAFGLPNFHVEIEDLSGCIYKLKTSCAIHPAYFKCVNGDIPMHLKAESAICPNKFMKTFHVELKSLIYGSTFNCTITNENKIYTIQKTVSCNVPYYVSGGILISLGILLAGVAVTVYLFKIGPTKHSTIWKFAMWYIGIIFVDIGVLLFLYTLSWESANTVFLPFLLLFIIKDIVILLIIFYVKKNGGFFFMNTSKVSIQTAPDQSSSQTPNNLTGIQ